MAVDIQALQRRAPSSADRNAEEAKSINANTDELTGRARGTSI